MCNFCKSKGYVTSSIFKDKKLMCPNPQCDSKANYQKSVFDKEEELLQAKEENKRQSIEEIQLDQAKKILPNLPEDLLKEMIFKKNPLLLNTCMGKFQSCNPYVASTLMRLHNLYADHIQTNIELSKEFKNILAFNPTRKIKNDP